MLNDDIDTVQECVSTHDNFSAYTEAWQRIKKLLLESQKPSTNNGSTPCRFFSRDKVYTGQSADGGSMYQSVPWCNHEPSQRAVP